MNKSKIVKKLSPAQLSVKIMGGKALAKKRKETMSPEAYSAYFAALQAKRKVRGNRFTKPSVENPANRSLRRAKKRGKKLGRI